MKKQRTFGPRYRQKPIQATTGVYEQWTVATNPPGPPVLNYRSGTQILTEGSDEMWDVTVPDYRKRVNAGEIIINPMVRKKYSFKCGGGSVIQDEQSGSKRHLYTTGTGSLIRTGIDAGQVVYPVLPSYDRDKIVAMAKANAIANIDKVPYPFLEDVLEIKETLNFIRHPLGEIADISDAARKFRRRRFGEAMMSSADALSSAWLKYRFAISPLLRSISQGMDALKDGFVNAPPRQIARGKNSVNYAASDRYVAGTYNKYMVTRTLNYTARAGIIYDNTNPCDTWKEALGLRFKDLPLGMWNIISLSFMLDRVWNVSTMIKGLTNLSDPTIKILGGWITVTEEEQKTATLESQTIPAWSCSTNSDTAYTETYLKTRALWTPSVFDTLVPVNLPKFSDLMPGDISSIVDLCALIQGRWR